MKGHKKSLWIVLGLIFTVTAILVYVTADHSAMAQQVTAAAGTQVPVSIQADMIQNKVLKGSDGKVVVALTLSADEIEPRQIQSVQHADLVVVLDRSGSMQGQKIDDARKAVMGLIDRLTAEDRLSLVSYSNGVHTHFPLLAMDVTHRRKAKAAVQQIYSGGGTNLGGGLDQGIQVLLKTTSDGSQRKVILISDGLANHGITDPKALGRMASSAVEHNFSVSTVGVGYDFNEVLMTTIADHGAGRYFFLENPNAFAQVFEKEFESTRNVAASAMELRVPMKDGVQLMDAGGYPIEIKNNNAIIHPGDMVSGQHRKFFLTFKVATEKERDFDLGAFSIHFKHNGVTHRVVSKQPLILACVADKKAVMASIDQEAWADQVVKEDFNQLKEEVATAIRNGQKDDALGRIQKYEARNRAVNANVKSAKVSENLKKDVRQLIESVEDTFAGAPAAVAEKKKQRSKALQYESYQIRRDKKY